MGPATRIDALRRRVEIDPAAVCVAPLAQE
jgi:hypothetical protein